MVFRHKHHKEFNKNACDYAYYRIQYPEVQTYPLVIGFFLATPWLVAMTADENLSLRNQRILLVEAICELISGLDFL